MTAECIDVQRSILDLRELTSLLDGLMDRFARLLQENEFLRLWCAKNGLCACVAELKEFLMKDVQ